MNTYMYDKKNENCQSVFFSVNVKKSTSRYEVKGMIVNNGVPCIFMASFKKVITRFRCYVLKFAKLY